MLKRLKFFTLAALVVLAACDEGDDSLGPGATGTITGTVTVDGTARAGVTVTLSSGATQTTSATGTYSFADVALGAYTVSIAAPAGTACPATTQAAVIATEGQSVTVNFACSAIRNSIIAVSVAGSTGPLSGVTVTLSGAGTGTATTNAGGVATLTGLAAGSYTVTISGAPAGQTCATPSQTTTVAAGETRSVSFTCTSAATASISGRLFIDGNGNNTYDSGTEINLAAANVTVRLEGPNVGDTTSTQTNATGQFTFSGLRAGSYNVTVVTNDPDLPAGHAFGGTSATVSVPNLPAGGSSIVNFPFDITHQTVNVYARLGRDANAAVGISTTIPATSASSAPVRNVIIDLYPTEADALASTNRLGRDTTDASGMVSFTFLRTADTSPAGAVQDQIVYAQYFSGPNNFTTLNGEARIEIRYDPSTSTGAAGDEFDFLNTRVTLKFDAVAETGEALAGWAAALWLNDTTAAATQSGVTDANGRIYFTDAVAAGALPDTFYMRLSLAQAAAGSHAFTQTPTPERGGSRNLFLRFVHQGLVVAGDTVDVGDQRVRFLDTDLFVRVYHERDDSTPGGPPRMSARDNIENVNNVLVTLRWRAPGATVDSTRLDVTPDPATGNITFGNVPTGQGPYTLRARSVAATQRVLSDTLVTLETLNGGVSGLTRVCPLGANTAAGCATFGFKYNNTSINGKVKAADSTAASGIIVTLAPTAQNIQPGFTSRLDTTDAAGLFSFTNIPEGPYTVSIAGTASWGLSNPATGSISIDMENLADNDILNFIVRRLDTQIHGVVVNDRDADLNTIDGGEALPGVTIQLYRDGSGTAVTLDTLVATTTTSATGAYSFTSLPEGRYVVKAVQPGTAVVLRAYEANGTVRDTAIVNTAATTVGSGADFTRVVGTATPASLPRWNYDNSSLLFNDRTHFTFLVNGNVATGRVTNAGAPLVGKLIRLRRCLTNAGSASPPAAGVCTTYFPGDPATLSTDATGFFTYSNLVEGVYEVMPVDASTPVSALFLLVRNGETADNERGDFTQP